MPGTAPRGGVAGGLVDHAGQQGAEQVDLDELAAAGGLPGAQRGEHADRGVQAGEHVDEGDAGLDRFAGPRAR